jgi:hypothetical protein
LWLKNLDDLSAPVREITTDSLFFTNYLAISPDGAIVVFNSRYATTADPATARDVDGVNTINNPTFTRDSQYLYYTVLLSGGGRIIKRADVPLSGVLTNYRPMTKDYDPAQGLGMSFVLTPDETRIVSTALIILGPPISSLKTLVYVTTADGSQDDAVLHPDFTNNVDYAYLPVITADSRYAFYANTINGQTNVSWTALNAPGTKVDVGNNPDGFNTTVAGDRAVFFRYYSGATQPWAWAEVNPTAIRGNFNPVGSGVPAPRSLAAAPDGSAVVFDGGAGIYAARGSQFSTATLLFTRPVSAAPTLLYAPESSSVAAANTSGLVMANPKAPGWVSDVLAQSEGQPGGPRCLAYVGGTCAY